MARVSEVDGKKGEPLRAGTVLSTILSVSSPALGVACCIFLTQIGELLSPVGGVPGEPDLERRARVCVAVCLQQALDLEHNLVTH